MIDLVEEGTAVVAPEGLVYSTHPRKALSLDGQSYYVKGPDKNIVVAEAVAHSLARSLGLRIPEFGIALPNGNSGPLFASREVERCHKQVDPWLMRDRAINRHDLPQLLAFDVWVMNRDRNIGNLVGEEQLSPNEGRIALVAIDFEKSMALRGPFPLTTTPAIPPNALWPSGRLGQLMAGVKLPDQFFTAIGALTDQNVLDAFGQVEAVLGEDVPWKESSSQLLARRANKIQTLAEEVWQ